LSVAGQKQRNVGEDEKKVAGRSTVVFTAKKEDLSKESKKCNARTGALH